MRKERTAASASVRSAASRSFAPPSSAACALARSLPSNSCSALACRCAFSVKRSFANFSASISSFCAAAAPASASPSPLGAARSFSSCAFALSKQVCTHRPLVRYR